MKAMAKVPADRFASIRQFLDALATPEITSVRPALPASSQSRSAVAAAAWWFTVGGMVSAAARVPTPAHERSPRSRCSRFGILRAARTAHTSRMG